MAKLGSERPAIKQLKTLEREAFNFALAVCDEAHHVYMTGGSGIAGRTAYELNLQKNDWVTLPRFTHARSEHAAIRTGENLYVFGGRDNKAQAVGSIEMLKCFKINNGHAKQWVMLMETEDLVKRENPSICAMGDGKVAVFGGYHNVSTLTDGYVFDEESKQVT